MAGTGVREQRSRLACDNCRRKKARCPGEQPSCSSCARLGQACTYRATGARLRTHKSVGRRLIETEIGVDGMTQDQTHTEQDRLNGLAKSHVDISGAINPSESSATATVPALSISAVVQALEVYLEYHHKQPIWCFDTKDVDSCAELDSELRLAVLALTTQRNIDEAIPQEQLSQARSAVMQIIAQGTVKLSTLQALCLVSQASFLAGQLSAGRVYLALGLELTQALFENTRSSEPRNHIAQCKSRLFWSFRVLEYHFGKATEQSAILKPPGAAIDEHPVNSVHSAPALPLDVSHPLATGEEGIYTFMVYISRIWSRTRYFVAMCMRDQLQEPWATDSLFTQISTELVSVEGLVPMCHRYQNAKFHAQDREDIAKNGHYWKPWLAGQFMYHTILMTLNHPFLYIAAAHSNKKLAVFNTFWRRSSQLVLLHATWIVRLCEIVQDRQVSLSEPIFAQASAMAATVHLYYCSASEARLKQKSISDLQKARQFVASFKESSVLCAEMHQKLETLLRISSGGLLVESRNEPSRPISVKSRLMWDLIDTACCISADTGSGTALFDPSLILNSLPNHSEDVTFDVGIAHSPEVHIDTTDGGQSGPFASIAGSSATLRASFPEHSVSMQSVLFEPQINNPSSAWLWDSDASNIEIHGFPLDDELEHSNDTFWWDLGNL